jgi:acylphosphatase
MIEVQIKIFGRVQGVFFRSETVKKAEELGIKGWVRNETDNTVITLVQGEEAAVRAFIEWCRTGPDIAHVDNIEVFTNDKPEKIFEDFKIEYS